MAETIKYEKIDRRAKIITFILLLLMIGVLFLVWYLWGEGWYITASGISLLLAINVLYILSIPRNIYIGETALEIRCLVEITHIPYFKLQEIRKMERDEMRKKVLVLGSYGYFGYFGYYLDKGNWEMVKLYCTQWRDFVEITDIYEQRYIINCKDADKLIAKVKKVKSEYV